VSLVVVAGARVYLGNDTFNDWGWRVPFLFSFLLVAIAIYIRLQLQETPIFEQIKARGGMAKNPWREAFLSSNVKFVGIASIVLIGQGVVWYSGQFTALYFLQQVSKLDLLTSSAIIGIALLIASPTLILFGWLSDLIGRKPVILGGMLLAGGHVLSPVFVARAGHSAGQHQLPGRDFDHLHPRVLRRDGLWAGRSIPGGIFPRPDPLHLGFGAVSYRQWLGRRVGAVHHRGGLPVGDPRQRPDLSDRGSRGVLRARLVLDA